MIQQIPYEDLAALLALATKPAAVWKRLRWLNRELCIIDGAIERTEREISLELRVLRIALTREGGCSSPIGVR